MTHSRFARVLTALAVALVAGPITLGAQSTERSTQRSTERSTERSIERLAENIAAAAERLAAHVERNAALLANRLEHEFNKKGSRWERDQERRRRQDDRDRVRDREDGIDWQDARSTLDTTITFSTNGTIELTNISGEIIVTGWNRREARIKAVSERGRLEYELSSSRITMDVQSARSNRGEGYRGETRYELSVPRGVRVIAHSTSGDVIVRGTGGDVEANSTSGDVTVDDASGRIEISSVSGDVQAGRLKGNVEANSVSGSVEVTDVEGGVHVGTTSGDISLVGVRSRDIEASTTSGDIEFEGVVEGDGRYEFHSHSGNITLTIPAASNAKFAVETFNGEMDSAFPLTLQPTDRTNRRPRRFEFNVGSGGARIIAETFSGDLEIRKR